jgi:hypothetical protein
MHFVVVLQDSFVFNMDIIKDTCLKVGFLLKNLTEIVPMVIRFKIGFRFAKERKKVLCC